MENFHVDELDGEKFDVIVSLKTFHHVLDPLETIIILVPGIELIITRNHISNHMAA